MDHHPPLEKERGPDPAAWPIAYPGQRWWPPPLECELLLDELELLLLLDELPCELLPLDQLPVCDGADGGGLVCTGG